MVGVVVMMLFIFFETSGNVLAQSSITLPQATLNWQNEAKKTPLDHVAYSAAYKAYQKALADDRKIADNKSNEELTKLKASLEDSEKKYQTDMQALKNQAAELSKKDTSTMDKGAELQNFQRVVAENLKNQKALEEQHKQDINSDQTKKLKADIAQLESEINKTQEFRELTNAKTEVANQKALLNSSDPVVKKSATAALKIAEENVKLIEAKNKVKDLQKQLNDIKDNCKLPKNCKEQLTAKQAELDAANKELAEAAVNYLKAQQAQIADQQFDTSKISIFEQGQARVGEGQGIWGFVIGLIRFATGIAGALAVLGLCIGGVMFIVAAGDESQIQTAKMTLMYSLIGLVVVILSYVIVTTVQTLTYGLAQPF